MMRSLFSGVSGLKNHQTRMDVIGNNISNVNTTGFKSSRVNFTDILSQNLQGASSPNGNMGGNRSYRGSYARGRRNARRDSMGRYSGDGYSRDGGMVEELRSLMEEAPDERTRQEFQRFIQKIENM